LGGLSVVPWVNNADYWDVKWAITEQVKLTFDKHGITIPYPQMEVHMQNPAVPVPNGNDQIAAGGDGQTSAIRA